MAATTLMKFKGGSQDNLAYEVWTASIGAMETECDITPTHIKSVRFVSLEPKDAASAATAIGYLKGSTFVPGMGTLTIVGANSTEYLVKIEGKVA